MSNQTFRPDSQIAEIAAAYSLDAVDIAAQNFGISLDWSDASIRKIEEMLGRLHDDMGKSRPPEDAVWTFAKAFGSYIGEVTRRNHGGVWGMISMDQESFPGLQQANGELIWPWSKAHKRLMNGPEDNVWHYFRLCTLPSGGSAPHCGDSAMVDTKTPSTKPWWKFW